jgi:hypothetical protein
MYQLSDVLAHFKRVCAFLETTLQHASCQKFDTICYPCKVCNNDVIFKDHEVSWIITWFGVVSWIITLSRLSTVRHNR